MSRPDYHCINPGPEPASRYTFVDFVDDWARAWLFCWPFLVLALLIEYSRHGYL